MREGKAVLVTDARDVVEELGGLGAEHEQLEIPATEFDRMSPVMQATLDGLDWRQQRTPIEIAAAVRLSAREVRAALGDLERRGLVSRTDGGWLLVRRADTG